jgi:hypothetical protein
MTIRLLTAFLRVLGLLPATASAAAPSCPDDNADELIPVAVGVPGEDVRQARDAGAVTLLEGGDITSCHSRELNQGDGLSGRPHRRARIGATLGIAPDVPGLDEDEYDSLLTGIPAGGILTLRAGYPAVHGRLAAPGEAPACGSAFALPS